MMPFSRKNCSGRRWPQVVVPLLAALFLTSLQGIVRAELIERTEGTGELLILVRTAPVESSGGDNEAVESDPRPYVREVDEETWQRLVGDQIGKV